VNSGYGSSGEVKIKTRSDQDKSCHFGTRPGQMWCAQVKLDQCEAKATARTRQDLSGLVRIKSMSRSGQVR